MTGSTPVRLRAAAVAVRDDHVLLVLRERAGRRYAVLPGGGVEPGETPQQACLRELREETGLDGALVGLVPPLAVDAVRMAVSAGRSPGAAPAPTVRPPR